MFINSFNLNTSLWSKSYYHPYCTNGGTEAQRGQVNNAIHTIRMEMNKVLGYIQDSVHGVRNTVETFQSLNIKIKTPQSHVRF